ncbi:MAG: GAF domain-containing protein [Rubrivivax sp.]|nr:GAF domain-containing protein [Rubrivivax sp.]
MRIEPLGPPSQPLHPGDAQPADTRILAEITAELASGDDLDALLQRLLAPIVRQAGAQAGAVRLLSESGKEFQVVSTLGLPRGACASGHSVDRHCGHCGAAADGHKVVWAADLLTCSRLCSGVFQMGGYKRLLVVPLQHHGRVLGVCNLLFASEQEPPPEVIALLRSVGELLGLALNNARLEQAQLQATLLHERQMMAAEVHDSLAQSLAFVKMRLPLLSDAVKAHDDVRALGYCDDLRGAVNQAHSSLRGIITHFRSPMDPQGLAHALDATVANFRHVSSAELDFANGLPGLRLAPEQESQVFHIVQEALNNVAKHAAARHARLHLAAARAGEVEIVVEDDGAGLPAGATAGGSHYGLEIMRERARRIGGTLDIGAREGGGTRVRLAFPLQAAALAPAPEAR